MKKILSILIFVLLGVGTTATFAQGTVTFNAYALGEGISQATNATTFGGGTIKITGYSASVGGLTTGYKASWSQAFSVEGTNITEKKASEARRGWTSAGVKVKLEATPSTGYYFDGFTETNSLTPISWVSKITPYGDTELSYNGSNYTKNYYAIFKKQSVHRDYAKVVAIYVDANNVPVFTGDILDPSSIVFTPGGGHVYVGRAATTSDPNSYEHGNMNTLVYDGRDSHTWNYTYSATPADGYALAGWYTEEELLKALRDNSGKLNIDKTQVISTSYTGSYETNSTDPANAPYAQTVYAVFRPSLTYYYSGASVYVADNEPEGGHVYVHKTDASGKPASVGAVTNWQTSHDDNTTYSQLDNPNYSYTYYAKPSDPAKYAFKGWSVSNYSDPSYGVDPLQPMYEYSQTMTEENTKEENRYITPALYAVFESFYYKAPPVSLATASQGAGYVYVDLTGSGMPANYTGTEMIAGTLQQVAATGVQHDYTVHYYASAIPGNVFVGWSTTADGNNIVSQSAHYQTTYNSQAKNRDYSHVAAPLYAVFRSDIDIRQQDRMIVYIDDEGNGNINDSKVLIDFQKANTLTATLSDESASLFSLSNRSGSKSGSTITFDATQGLIELVVTYKGDLATAVGKVANITLSATYGEPKETITRPVTIVVEEAPIITFLPTDGKGAYTIKMTNGSGINYTMNANAQENIKVAVTHESMSNIEMALTQDVSADNYYFFGWQMIDGEAVTYLSYDALHTYQFTKAVKVKAEFIPKNLGTYFILSDPAKTLYHDLQKALDEAQVLYTKNSVPQTVVLNDYQGATRITESMLPQGNYTIHQGVTLLIPGDNKYTSKDVLGTDDYDDGTKTAKPYMKWIVEDGTTFTVKGNVSVYSRLNANGQTWVGRPWQYGWIEMGENCKMTFESGANLYAYGYITGPISSSVILKSGAVVKEAFQILDWHGGTETLEYLNLGGVLTQNFAKDQKVFPASQYYIQNVEVPMTLEYGATEYLSAGVAMGSLTVVETPFMGTNSGFLRLVDGVSVTKYYDKYTDSQIYTVTGNGTSEAKLGNITLKADIGVSATLNSAHFVLPLPHNMDIRIVNTRVNVLYDLAFLAGAKLTVDKNSRFIINGTSSQDANVFVYDKDQNGAYFGISNNELIPVGARPGGILYERKAEDLLDASFMVDGVVETGNYGYLYTTSSGANITSHGGGKMQFAKVGTKSTTYQRKMSDWVSIAVNAAKLRNGDGSYANYPGEATTYTYHQNKWQKNLANGTYVEPTVIDYVPKFSANNKTFTAFVGKSDSKELGVTTNNNDLSWNDVTWSYSLTGTNADQFIVEGTLPEANVEFEPTSEGIKTATLNITAKYVRSVHGQSVTYVYTKAVYLTGNASYLAPNTLEFAELNDVYYGGQTKTYNFFNVGTRNNTKPIIVSCPPDGIIHGGGEINDINRAMFRTRGKGEVTITATQDADLVNNVAGIAISKKIKVTDPVLWNWDVLYFGTVNKNPITVLDGSTGWKLEKTSDEYNIINFQGENPADYTATIENQIAGKYTDIQFTFTGKETKTFESHVITNPQHLRVDVNNDIVYRAVTLSANENVRFNKDQIEFSSTAQTISQWKMTFIGVPDKLHFIPRGTNTWQIEESANGVNWTTSFPWKYITSNTDFELSLLPSTRYLRISYGAGNVNPDTKVNKSILREFYITELADVKADVEKLYMPMQLSDATDNTSVIPASKELVLTYANTSKLYVTTSDENIYKITGSANNILTIPATTDETPFGIMGIEVVSQPANNTEEKQGYLYVHEGANLVLQIPISTYLFPQKLPIKLATDKPDGGDRYYFVTTHTHNAEWDGTDGVRKITLNNAVSDAAPYLTFAYDGAPTYISFDFTPDVHGTWELEQFVEGEWKAVTPDSKDDVDIASGKFKRFVSSQARQLRVIYQSDYAEKVEITELVIVGDASVIVDPARMVLDVNNPEELTVTAINLPSMTVKSTNPNFTISHDNGTNYGNEYTLTGGTGSSYKDQLGDGKIGDITFKVKWSGTDAVEVGELRITTTINDKVLGTVELTGIQGKITNGDIKMNTGVPEGYTLASVEDEENEGWKGDNHRPVNISAAFSPEGTPLFDYVVVYGETTTADGSRTITLPNKLSGSNAKTPCYIYKKGTDCYEFLKRVENVNAKDKAWDLGADDKDAVSVPAEQNSVSMYITGFAPYASTGYTKADEGVWYFRANGGQSIDIYLEDCYIYSRAKTDDGHTFADRSDGYSFVEPYACGSGAVLVFACNEQANATPMNVTIHTLGNNLLKSNYGCFLQSIAGRAFQASSPVQIRVINDQYVRATRTTLNFTDEWLASKNSKTVDGSGNAVRTNGFLSLQKQVNNAPSIDMGAPNTIVNFNGGQVELQNAQIVSTNYASSLAICHRSGKFAGVPLAYGMGTDAVEGTVNFNDGTTTVRDMWVVSTYAESYLLDRDQNGDYITKVEKGKTYYLTSCLRTPANTFVYGGSHCMMRACTDPTTSGGAPRNKPESEGGVLLGLYKYPKLDPNPADAENKTSNFGWVPEGDNGLVRPNSVPTGYGISSVTPNDNGTPTNYDDDYLNFWFDPTFEESVQPEVEKTVSFWKTCMTKISAVYAGYGGTVGGDATIMMNGADQLEIVKNLMYCQIDEQIRQVISSPNYYAPVKNPAPEGENYLPVHPSSVGEQIAHYVTNVNPFQVEDRVYYITTATADVWNAFTAPFDVANIYIMETYPESELEAMEGTVVDGVTMGRTQIIQEQAKHNADFAAFFAVTVALGQQKDFETIYREYMAWANMKDEELGLNSKQGYEPRGKRKLIPFDGSNWAEADFYLNENTADWIYTGEEGKEFTTSWTPADASDGKLMEKGNTYAMLLPFCMGCGEDINTRTFWDYWSGKFLIFESTSGSPHIIDGSAAMEEIVNNIPTMNSSTAKLTGNSTFSHLTTQNQNIYNYVGNLQHSTFKYSSALTPVQPTQSFLLANIPVPAGVQVDGVTRSGKIIYGPSGNGNNPGTGVHTPTVGGDNSLFITAINGGINVAVAAPQHVRVLSATGATIYSGMVQTAVDVNLPTDGIYIVSGEREVQKILY